MGTALKVWKLLASFGKEESRKEQQNRGAMVILWFVSKKRANLEMADHRKISMFFTVIFFHKYAFWTLGFLFEVLEFYLSFQFALRAFFSIFSEYKINMLWKLPNFQYSEPLCWRCLPFDRSKKIHFLWRRKRSLFTCKLTGQEPFCSTEKCTNKKEFLEKEKAEK